MNKKIIIVVALFCLLFTACSNNKEVKETISSAPTTISTEPVIEVMPGNIEDLDKTNSEPAIIKESQFEIKETESQEDLIEQFINNAAN